MVKTQPASAADTRDEGLVSGWGRSPGVGNDNLLQYSCLKTSMDRGTSWLQSMGLQRVRHDSVRHD